MNIPIEIIRSAVAVIETRSHSGAARTLGLSQPAVTTQMKRLRQIMGIDIFVKEAADSGLSPVGKIFYELAKNMIAAHDQILNITTSSLHDKRLRVGFTPMLGSLYLSSFGFNLENVLVRTAMSPELFKDFVERRLDLICCFIFNEFDSSLAPHLVEKMTDQLDWIHSPDFKFELGTPIPVVTWRGDKWMATTLSKSGIDYRIVFDGESFEAKRSAVLAGLGLSAAPRSLISNDFVRVEGSYLPKLPPITLALYARTEGMSDTDLQLIEGVREHIFRGLCHS